MRRSLLVLGAGLLVAVAGCSHARRPAFFGVPTDQPRRLVYVLDRSGSMTCSLDFVKYELQLSIRELRDDQQFQVLFMSSGPPFEMRPRGLVPATDNYKATACQFIDAIIPQGEIDPGPAMQRALELKPDAVYMLTDGECDRSLVEFIRQKNPGRKVAIHCMLFLYRLGEDVLKEIAAENHGVYKFISEADL